ncbi:MAG: nicotinate phosphoribosyltransferase [Janthinobacterium lividum]
MIIDSLLDTDLYKFTMQEVVWNHFPNAQVEYAFKCRSRGADLSVYAEEIREELAAYCRLRLTETEASFLRSIAYLKPSYLDALGDLTLNPDHVKITVDPTAAPEDRLQIRIVGSWFQTILFEVPLLAIVNEIYFRHTQPDDAANREEGRRWLEAKVALLANTCEAPVNLIEFGTRRRYSQSWQEEVIAYLKENLQGVQGGQLLGTSNMAAAMRFELRPYGTMAHEFLQACQALVALPEFQKFAFDTWMQEYRGDLGIALSDVVGMDAFLQDFDKLFCKAYDGARHDSGDPYEWGEKLIQHYKSMGIDPATKSAVFSDSLDIPRAIALAGHFHGRIRTSFGIGTNLTNDMGFEPLSIVIKMTRCNGRPVAKLSDSPGKIMCQDDVYLSYLRQTFEIA